MCDDPNGCARCGECGWTGHKQDLQPFIQETPNGAVQASACPVCGPPEFPAVGGACPCCGMCRMPDDPEPSADACARCPPEAEAEEVPA